MTPTNRRPPTRRTQSSETRRPLLRVVKGDATPEEVAALVAVVAALGSGGAEPPQPRDAGVVGAPPQGAAHPAARPGRLALQRPAGLTVDAGPHGPVRLFLTG